MIREGSLGKQPIPPTLILRIPLMGDFALAQPLVHSPLMEGFFFSGVYQMKFKDYKRKPETIRAYQLKPKDMSIVKFEGGSIYSIGLVEFSAMATPEAGDYLVYKTIGEIPYLVLQEHFEGMIV